jgi:hypothetical protein
MPPSNVIPRALAGDGKRGDGRSQKPVELKLRRDRAGWREKYMRKRSTPVKSAGAAQ